MYLQTRGIGKNARMKSFQRDISCLSLTLLVPPNSIHKSTIQRSFHKMVLLDEGNLIKCHILQLKKNRITELFTPINMDA